MLLLLIIVGNIFNDVIGNKMVVMVLFVAFFSGADIAATDIESYTPLMVAAAAGHFEAFDILLGKNSAIDDVDQERQTVLHLAARENHIFILKV